jgi:hypothetical protein
MVDNATALDSIERAASAAPWCWCGEPTMAAFRDGTIWLECRSLEQPRSRLRRVLTLDFSHLQRPVLRTSDFGLAA